MCASCSAFRSRLSSSLGVALVDRRRAAAAEPQLLALAARRRACADRRDRADARRDGRALVRRRRRLHQDRADPGRDLRAASSSAIRSALPMMVAIVIATAGVVVMSLQARRHDRRHQADARSGSSPAACSRSRRSAIAARSSRSTMPDFVMAATFTLACGLVLQAALLTAYLALRDRAVLARDRGAMAAARCSRASWARSPRSSGFSPSRSRPPRACARSRWSRCCSRRRSRLHLQAADQRARRRRHGDDRDRRDRC